MYTSVVDIFFIIIIHTYFDTWCMIFIVISELKAFNLPKTLAFLAYASKTCYQ